MRIAIIGAGISGLVAAHELHATHDLTIFEAGSYIGGHTHTHDISVDGETYAIDTGFIVFNDWTYPRFIALLDELGVKNQETSMSFSVKCSRTGLEYNGTSFNSLFAQRSNLFRPSFWRMLNDIRRFNRDAQEVLRGPASEHFQSLGAFLLKNGYSRRLRDYYLLPMGSAIWSATEETMLKFPLIFFLKFLNNHGMLSINDRPQWRTVVGGSKSYVEPLTKPFREKILLNNPVQNVRRLPGHVEITDAHRTVHHFDKVIFAAHSDQALRMLQDPTTLERDILSSLPYEKNTAVLHTDASVLPKKPLAWASWNYHLLDNPSRKVTVTYNMNILQRLNASKTFCVTLNCEDQIDPTKILKRMVYHHPIYTISGVKNQARHAEISGHNRTYYAGAYWFNGFHEDGVRSGQRVAKQILGGLDA